LVGRAHWLSSDDDYAAFEKNRRSIHSVMGAAM
jgi:hypothetical protein